MADHGGKRSGSGRPKGAKSAKQRLIKAKAKAQIRALTAQEDAKAFAMSVLNAAEPEVAIRILESGDIRLQFEMIKLYKSYAQGPPVHKLQVESGPSPLAVLSQILEERRERRALEEKRQLALPAAIEVQRA